MEESAKESGLFESGEISRHLRKQLGVGGVDRVGQFRSAGLADGDVVEEFVFCADEDWASG